MTFKPSSCSAFRPFGNKRKAMGRRALLGNPEVERPFGSSRNAQRIHVNALYDNQKRTNGTPEDVLSCTKLGQGQQFTVGRIFRLSLMNAKYSFSFVISFIRNR